MGGSMTGGGVAVSRELFRVIGELEEDLASARFVAPPLPARMGEVIGLTSNPVGTLVKVRRMIERDAALGAVILRAARSPLYGVDGDCVDAALKAIGADGARKLVLLYELEGSVYRGRSFDHVMSVYWRHAAASALAADLIWRTQGHSSGEAFLVGLLHDIGRPIALAALLDRLRNVHATEVAPAIGRIVDAIHAQVGGLVAAAWGLPLYMRHVIQHHHDLPCVEHDTTGLCHLIVAADALTGCLGCGNHTNLREPVDAEAISQTIQVPRSMVLTVLETLERQVTTYVGW